MSEQVSEPERVEILKVLPAGTDLAPIRGVERNPVEAYLATVAASTRRSMVGALACALAVAQGDRLSDLSRSERAEIRQRVRSTDWTQLRNEHVAAIRQGLQAEYSPSQANKALAAIRGVLKAAWRIGYLDRDQFERAVDVPPVKGTKVDAGRSLTDREVLDLLRTCEADESVVGLRDGVMLTFGLGVGCRVAEIAALTLEDYNPETGEIVLTGKGNKQRKVWADNEIADALGDWIAVRGPEPGPLFCAVDRQGEILLADAEGKPAHMSTWAIQKRLKARAAQAGVAAFSWHDLRRTHITNALDLGIDVLIVSKNVGHANVATTAGYDRRPDRARRQAMTKLRIPYKARLNGRGK